MYFYIFLVWIASLFGHRKARMLMRGQRQAIDELRLLLMRKSGRQKRIWIHVASVGEFEQARPIIERLRSGDVSAICHAQERTDVFGCSQARDRHIRQVRVLASLPARTCRAWDKDVQHFRYLP